MSRRRRDMAVLQAVGFVRRQVRAVVVWQGVTLGALSLVLGLPLGVAAGRWIWILFARDRGFVGEPIVLIAEVAAVGAGVLVLAAALATQAGRLAARTRPAIALRSE